MRSDWKTNNMSHSQFFRNWIKKRRETRTQTERNIMMKLKQLFFATIELVLYMCQFCFLFIICTAAFVRINRRPTKSLTFICCSLNNQHPNYYKYISLLFMSFMWCRSTTLHLMPNVIFIHFVIHSSCFIVVVCLVGSARMHRMRWKNTRQQ